MPCQTGVNVWQMRPHILLPSHFESTKLSGIRAGRKRTWHQVFANWSVLSESNPIRSMSFKDQPGMTCEKHKLESSQGYISNNQSQQQKSLSSDTARFRPSTNSETLLLGQSVRNWQVEEPVARLTGIPARQPEAVWKAKLVRPTETPAQSKTAGFEYGFASPA